MDLKEAITETAVDLEGSDFTHDPEATRYGIVQSEYDNYRSSHGLNLRSVNEIAENEYFDIYIARYWLPMRCGELPDGVDFVIFQMGVNIGNGTAVRILQRALGVDVDGRVGPETVEAASAANTDVLIDALLNMQEDHYDALAANHPDNQLFQDSLLGWHNRVLKVRLFLGTGFTEKQAGFSLLGIVALGAIIIWALK